MTKKEIIKIIVPATIKCWTAETPEYKHEGKERKLSRMYWEWKKEDLMKRLESLKEKGFVEA